MCATVDALAGHLYSLPSLVFVFLQIQIHQTQNFTFLLQTEPNEIQALSLGRQLVCVGGGSGFTGRWCSSNSTTTNNNNNSSSSNNNSNNSHNNSSRSSLSLKAMMVHSLTLPDWYVSSVSMSL